MNLTRCSNGHFYDADASASCPHCAHGNDQNETVALVRNVGEDSVTTPLTSSPAPKTEQQAPQNLADAIGKAQNQAVSSSSAEDDSKTISYNQVKLGSEPVVGWLVCIEGEHLGEDFRLKTGKNFIGRASNMDAALVKDKSVSRDKHAIVLYEPKAHIFLVQPGEARELSYLNDQVVLAAQELKRNDVITVGESKLMFFPCCDSVFNWDKAEAKEEK